MMTNDSQKDCTLYLINCVINKNENEKIINKCNISLSEYAVTGVKNKKHQNLCFCILAKQFGRNS